MNRHCTAFNLGLLLSVFFSLSSQSTLAGDYADSAHGDASIGVDRSSINTDFSNYATGNCAHCHEQHASLNGPTGGPNDYLLFDVTNNNLFCNTCHDGSPVTGDVASQTTMTSGHNPATTKTPGNITAVCMDCHDPHAATEVAHVEATDGNTASGVLKNVAGVTATGWSTPPPPSAGNETLTGPSYTATNVITKEYELCLKCHSSYAFGATPPTGWTDQGQEFNPYNFAFHPVTESTPGQQWNNAYIRANQTTAMAGNWALPTNLDARMHCSDCHGDDTGGAPQGPHGSNSAYILRATGPGNSYDNLCLLCHNPTSSSAFGNHTTGQHTYGGGNLLGCVACHAGPVGNYGGRRGNIHGTNYQWADSTAGKKTYVGLPSQVFLVGGYVYALGAQGTSRYCQASDSTAGVNDGGCGGHGPKSF